MAERSGTVKSLSYSRTSVRGVQLHDLAVFVLHERGAGHEIGAAEADFLADREAVELLHGVLHEVVALDVERLGERDLACAGGGVFRIVHGLDLLDLALRVVVDHELERIHDRHGAARGLVQVLLNLVTPMVSQKSRMAEAGMPRRRMPQMVGMRGSSQPFTRPVFTSSRSLRLLMTV